MNVNRLGGSRSCFDLQQIAEVKVGDGHHRAGRASVAEELREDAVEGVPMVDADEKSGHVEHAVTAGAGGGQHAIEVGEHLAGLVVERAVAAMAAVVEERQLARGEDEPAIAERRDVMRARARLPVRRAGCLRS